MTVPRVVLDTNCLVSALIFSRGRFAWLREAWQAQRFIALASHDTVSELLRVLRYPKFKLSHNEQGTLLAEFLPHVETVKIDTTPGDLPNIRDPDDLLFLVLAAVAKADALVSGDGDIQAVKEQFHIPILTMVEFADWLQAH
jgi:putative PIN family toxin of toxin-antitoxin system